MLDSYLFFMKKSIGFTLTELLLTLAILSILLGISVPFLSTVKQQFLADSTMRQLYRAIQLARMMAIRQRTFISLCPTQNGRHCTRSANWNASGGFLLFQDKNKLGKISSNFQKHLFKPMSKQAFLVFKGFPRSDLLRFTPLGMTDAQNGTFYYCYNLSGKSGRTPLARALIVSQSGRIRFSQDKNRDGFYEDSQGRPLRCF
jgi:type IV fimbrial biogenesis protein FimT